MPHFSTVSQHGNYQERIWLLLSHSVLLPALWWLLQSQHKATCPLPLLRGPQLPQHQRAPLLPALGKCSTGCNRRNCKSNSTTPLVQNLLTTDIIQMNTALKIWNIPHGNFLSAFPQLLLWQTPTYKNLEKQIQKIGCKWYKTEDPFSSSNNNSCTFQQDTGCLHALTSKQMPSNSNTYPIGLPALWKSFRTRSTSLFTLQSFPSTAKVDLSQQETYTKLSLNLLTEVFACLLWNWLQRVIPKTATKKLVKNSL